jgi:hypothetical protein
MVDVTVDMKPMEKLPYDPNDIPPAVRKRAEAVNALYGSTALTPLESGGSTQAAVPSVAPEPGQSPGSVPAPQAPTPSVTSSPTHDPSVAPADLSPEDAATWRNRYLAMQGRHAAAQKTIGEMQEQMEQLGGELLKQTQRPQPPQQRRVQQPAPTYLTERDEQNYGPELIDFAQRAAVQAVRPHLQDLESQNVNLRQQLAKEARRRLDQSVEVAVPNFREIDANPRWHRWLLGIDVYSGRVRQELLNRAIAAAEAPRVISFFKGFLQEETATGHIEPVSSAPATSVPRGATMNLNALAAPGRARPATGGDAMQPDKPIYTRAQVKELYAAHLKGAYVGREAEWNRIEADLFAAQREGRYR